MLIDDEVSAEHHSLGLSVVATVGEVTLAEAEETKDYHGSPLPPMSMEASGVSVDADRHFNVQSIVEVAAGASKCYQTVV
jgi:hypothetical protein